MKFAIRTWKCESCGYKQDFDPQSELMLEIYPTSYGLCPTCGGDFAEVTENSEKIAIKLAEDTELAKTDVLVSVTNDKKVTRKVNDSELEVLITERDEKLQELTESPDAIELF